MGAVYMGALTYIGNAPNFMVFAIANERGVKMPSFFGYMLWSCRRAAAGVRPAHGDLYHAAVVLGRQRRARSHRIL